MSTRKASMAVATVWLSALATAVSAQSFDQQRAQCVNEGRQSTPAISIAACTALLQSGRFDSQGLSIVHSNRGNAYRAQGDLDRALADYDEAIRLNPANTYAYNNRGIQYRVHGEIPRAIADFDEAIRLNPQDASP